MSTSTSNAVLTFIQWERTMQADPRVGGMTTKLLLSIYTTTTATQIDVLY